MQLLISLAILLTTSQLYEAAVDVNGDKYLNLSAADKADIIWKNCQESETPEEWFYKAITIGLLLTEGMCPTFDTRGDQLPYRSFLMGYRKKVIHTVGAIGKVDWVSRGDHGYTGLFKGATHGFVRLSLASKPVESPPKTVPGISVKFLRDGRDSANFVAMFSLEGQPSFNFFKNDFWNHVAAPPTGFAFRTVQAKFATATNYPLSVGLSDFSKYGNDGKEVTEIKFPYKLRFHRPNGTTEFSDEYHGDFLEDLKTIQKGVLYEVHAMDNPEELNGTESHIADLVLTSDIETSQWADERMFFRHQDMAADVKLHPEWDQFTDKQEKDKKPKVICPFQPK